MLVPTDEEQRLLDLLRDTDWWDRQCGRRRIVDTKLASAELTESGVVAELTLDGQWALEDLEKKHAVLRTMLDVYDHDLTDLTPGGRAAKVLFSVRTRYITDELDMLWHPDITTLGRDTVTGEEVDVPRHERLLVGGTSGSGKSWSTRSLMARAVVHPDERLAGFLDGKGEESTIWRGVCPTFVSDESIVEGIESAWEEMDRRRVILEKEHLGMWTPELGPRLLYVIDEGQVVLSAVENHDKARNRRKFQDADEALDGPEKSVMQKLRELSSQGRTREVIIMWMTQNPLVSGDGKGITSEIRANFDYRFCLRVNGSENTTVVLGNGSGVEPHKLPRGKRFRGYGYLNTHNRNLIHTWTVTNEMVPLLAYPDHGRGRWPRDVALKALQSQPGALWTPDLLTSHTGCGRVQADRFLRSFSREGLLHAEGDRFRLVA
jgi:S-DNA-T family DNA segregation ATPase FtsK/SpoIIIE